MDDSTTQERTLLRTGPHVLVFHPSQYLRRFRFSCRLSPSTTGPVSPTTPRLLDRSPTQGVHQESPPSARRPHPLPFQDYCRRLRPGSRPSTPRFWEGTTLQLRFLPEPGTVRVVPGRWRGWGVHHNPVDPLYTPTRVNSVTLVGPEGSPACLPRTGFKDRGPFGCPVSFPSFLGREGQGADTPLSCLRSVSHPPLLFRELHIDPVSEPETPRLAQGRWGLAPPFCSSDPAPPPDQRWTGRVSR